MIPDVIPDEPHALQLDGPQHAVGIDSVKAFSVVEDIQLVQIAVQHIALCIREHRLVQLGGMDQLGLDQPAAVWHIGAPADFFGQLVEIIRNMPQTRRFRTGDGVPDHMRKKRI